MHFTVIVVDLIFYVALLVSRVPPRISLLYRQMIVGAHIQGHALVMHIHDRDLFDWFFFGYRLALVEERNTRLRQPLSEHPVE